MIAAPDPAIQLVLRASLALLFAVTAWHKLRDLRGFREAVGGYALLPRAVVAPIATLLPLLELSAGSALVVPGLSRVGAGLAIALLSLYSAAIAANLLRGRAAIDCGCAGPAAKRSLGPDLLLRNALLALAAGVVALTPSTRALVWLDALTIAGGVTLAALLYTATETGLANHRTLRTFSESR